MDDLMKHCSQVITLLAESPPQVQVFSATTVKDAIFWLRRIVEHMDKALGMTIPSKAVEVYDLGEDKLFMYDLCQVSAQP